MATGADTCAKKAQHFKLLYSGQKILYREKYEYAVLSGKINSVGITVGHIGNIGNGIPVKIRDACDEQIIAEIVHRIEGTIRGKDEEFTADISFMKMSSNCTVKNILRCVDRRIEKCIGEFGLVLHKGSITSGEAVMVVDQDGFMKKGKIKSSRFNWKDTNREVINALSIVDENNNAIARQGQSGSLVTSCPQPGSDVLRVYGIVTHIHHNRNSSSTIANRLWDVLRAYHDRGQYPLALIGETPSSIDFAKD